MRDALHAENLAYIQSEPVRRAYRAIVGEAQRAKLRGSVLASSAPRPIRLYGRVGGKEYYLFSCNRARQHLSFYIRNPALARWPWLAAEAAARFAVTEVNGMGETIVKIVDETEADRLAQWLFAGGRWERDRTA